MSTTKRIRSLKRANPPLRLVFRPADPMDHLPQLLNLLLVVHGIDSVHINPAFCPLYAYALVDTHLSCRWFRSRSV